MTEKQRMMYVECVNSRASSNTSNTNKYQSTEEWRVVVVEACCRPDTRRDKRMRSRKRRRTRRLRRMRRRTRGRGRGEADAC